MTRLAREVAEGNDITTDLDTLEGLHQAMGAADVDIRAKFKDTEARLKAAGLPPEIEARHQQAVADYESMVQELQKALREIKQHKQEREDAEKKRDQAGAAAKYDQLKRKVQETETFLQNRVTEPPHTPLDPDKLPHRTPEVKDRAPRLKKEEFTELQPRILLAFQGELSAQLIAQADPGAPKPEDLAETIDAQFSQGIRDLATALGESPLAIFNWVRQNIAFVPTFGSIQGSEACRLSRECNAHDAASLLVALLRVSGIPARYVVGTIEVGPDLFRSAMGDFQDLAAAARLASSGGIPVTLVNDAAGATVAVRMEHVWIEAYVNYVPSRGAAKGPGDTWVPLDPSLKPTRFQPPVDVRAAGGEDPQAVVDALLASGTRGADGNSITGISRAEANARLTTIAGNLKTFINQNMPDATVGEVLGAVDIQATPLSVLPASLPARVLVVGGRPSALPPSARHQVVLQVMARFGFGEEIRLERSTAELAGKRVTIGYVPAAAADVATIESFGGLLNAPPYLVNLRPVVYVDGVSVGAGSALRMGTLQKILVSFQEPDGGTDGVEHVITAGTYAALGLDLQRISREALDARKAKLDATRALVGVQDLKWDDMLGEILHLHAQSYFLQVEASNRLTAHQLNVGALKRPAEMLATFSPAFAFFFGSAVDITRTGMNVDVRRYVVSVASRTGQRDRERAYVLTTGSFGSAAEHGVFEHLQNARSVSAVKLIAEANDRGIPVFAIDAANVAAILPQLQVSSAVVNDVRNAVGTGKRVLIPREDVPFLNWTGVGYIVLDPDTGAGGYLISGGLAGGGTAESSSLQDLLEKILDVISFLLDEFSAIAGALRVLSKALAWAELVGKILTGLSAIATAYSVYSETGSLWKGLVAGLIDLGLSLLAGVAITALVGFFAPTVAGIIALVVSVIVITVVITLIENFILGLLTGSLRPSRRRMYARVAPPDRNQTWVPFSGLEPAWQGAT